MVEVIQGNRLKIESAPNVGDMGSKTRELLSRPGDLLAEGTQLLARLGNLLLHLQVVQTTNLVKGRLEFLGPALST